MGNTKRLLLYRILLLIAIFSGYVVFHFTDIKKAITPPTHEFSAKKVKVVKISPTTSTKLPPTSIRIEKLDIFLPVSAALVEEDEWDLFEDKVSWLSTSAVPGSGSVVLYAHDKKEMFGDLYKLERGDTVEVMQGEEWKKYTVKVSKSVSPSDVDAVLSDKNQLILYTCEGSFDQKRRVIYADPQSR